MNFIHILIFIVIFDFTLGIVLTNIEMYRTPDNHYTVFKTATSLDFLLMAVLIFIYTGQKVFFGFLPGYVCCILGDVLLALAKRSDGSLISGRFLAGMGFFGLGHVFYILRFWNIATGRLFFPIFFAALYALATVVASHTRYFNYGHKWPYCAVYGAMVGCLGGLGINAIIAASGAVWISLMGLGAFLFMCSDAVVAFKYFLITEKKCKQMLGHIELTLYYIAMGLLSIFPLFMM